MVNRLCRKEIIQDFPAVPEDLKPAVKVMLREGLEYKLHTVSVVVYKQYIRHIISQDFTSFLRTVLQRVRPSIFLLLRAQLFHSASRRKVQKLEFGSERIPRSLLRRASIVLYFHRMIRSCKHPLVIV